MATFNLKIAIVPTACGIETLLVMKLQEWVNSTHCNSTYRLRY